MACTRLALAALFGVAVCASAQTPNKSVTLEVLVAENARVYLQGQETTATGTVRIFESPPLPEGKYTYTVKAVMAGPKGPREVTRQVDVRPGDFESVDLREHQGKDPVPDVIYEPTPPKVVDAMLWLAGLKPGDVLWDLGCGDGRILVTAAQRFGIKARGFDIDPELVRVARDNVRKNGVGNLVTIEQKDIFTLDLSKEPTVVTLYLLPRLNTKLLPQLQKLPPGTRIVSNTHRIDDIKPDQQMTVDTEQGMFVLYLWKVETLQRARP